MSRGTSAVKFLRIIITVSIMSLISMMSHAGSVLMNSYSEKLTEITTCVGNPPCTETLYGQAGWGLAITTTNQVVSEFSAGTRFELAVGDYSTSFTLGEDPKYVPGALKASIKRTIQVDGKATILATFKLKWIGNLIVIKLKTRTGEDFGPAMSAGDVLEAEPPIGNTATLVNTSGTITNPGLSSDTFSGPLNGQGSYAVKNKAVGNFTQETRKVSLKLSKQ